MTMLDQPFVNKWDMYKKTNQLKRTHGRFHIYVWLKIYQKVQAWGIQIQRM